MSSDLKTKATATCLCGKVHIFAPHIYAQLQDQHDAPKSLELNVCHCTQCRQWVGGPFLVTNAGCDVEINGDEHITRYASSDWAERGFCKSCGTSLFYYFKPKQAYMICAGAFQDLDFTMTSQIFIDQKPSYYCFADQTVMMTGDEVMQMMQGAGK